MRVTADLDKCEGYANCVAAAPDIFDIDDDGKVVLLEVEVDETKRDNVEEAVRTCPVSALDVEG
jgi:3-phenylpropionate/trans-cinnamate dioxygenase ferredoxin reductase subunit